MEEVARSVVAVEATVAEAVTTPDMGATAAAAAAAAVVVVTARHEGDIEAASGAEVAAMRRIESRTTSGWMAPSRPRWRGQQVGENWHGSVYWTWTAESERS